MREEGRLLNYDYECSPQTVEAHCMDRFELEDNASGLRICILSALPVIA